MNDESALEGNEKLGATAGVAGGEAVQANGLNSADIDGVLRDVEIEPIGPDRNWARGRLYGDRKGRFSDGERIHTSYLVSGPDEHGIIRTRNSVYRIEGSYRVLGRDLKITEHPAPPADGVPAARPLADASQVPGIIE